MEHDVAHGVLEGRRVMGEHSDQTQAIEPGSLPNQESEVGAGGGFHASVEQSAKGGEGDGVLRVLQRAKIEIGCGENRCGILAKISQ
jgi:hypothetical protein